MEHIGYLVTLCPTLKSSRSCLHDIQHGFRKSYSCETQLRITLEDLAKNLDHGKENDIILLDILKLLILSHTNASYSS